MSARVSQPVICVLGATATGKSELAEALCADIDGEIVSADSMQVYRGMDIGTAKVPATLRKTAYHCIDLVDPGEPYSAALFQADARHALADIDARGKHGLLCGGTGLYVRAVVDDMKFAAGDQSHNPVRAHYSALLEKVGAEELHRQLAQADPQSAELIHPNNTRRVIRAFEMLSEGESYAARKATFKSLPPFMPSVKIVLEMDTQSLYERINRRVERMFEEGLVEEVQTLLSNGFRKGLTAPQAIGYKETVRYLDGLCTLDEAKEDIKQATRRYAKRQRTWLRSERDANVFNVDSGLDHAAYSRILRLIVNG